MQDFSSYSLCCRNLKKKKKQQQQQQQQQQRKTRLTSPSLGNSRSITMPTSVGYNVSVFVCGLIALIYLLNPTAGMLELIPDNFPIIGNLDEAGATLILFHAIRHLTGFDVMNLGNRLYNDVHRNHRRN